jgi:hypothetical protein
MTNKRKIEVLKAMLTAKRLPEGLCCALYDVSRSRKFKGMWIGKSLGSYGIRKPKDADDPYWFMIDRQGTKKRKELIKNAIKKLSK